MDEPDYKSMYENLLSSTKPQTTGDKALAGFGATAGTQAPGVAGSVIGGGATGAAVGGVPGAAVGAGVGLVKGLLEQKAAKEKRALEQKLQYLNAQDEAQSKTAAGQTSAFNALMARYSNL
jgi:hypothetical protein